MRNVMRAAWVARGIVALSLAIGATRVNAESLCAEVQISIKQEVTFERQGFEAHMKINNGLEGIDITDIGVAVKFTDANNEEVLASSDPNETNPDVRFFIQLDDAQTNIAGDVDANTASVPGSTSADIYWLIIPTPDTANVSPAGKLYYVGATLSYKLGGDAREVSVSPDYIYVKPTPLLSLDYFLPRVGDGDDPNTRAIEASTPFSLGVRVRNDGFGTAGNFAIASAQPKIVDNQLGLLIGFQLVSAEVNGKTSGTTLKVNFGDIEPQKVGVARWMMETTLAGQFKNFEAEFTHADSLGGKLTSLIEAVNTHTLVRDVLVDAPGRDSVRDFLASDNGSYQLYDSENLDSESVLDRTMWASLTLSGAAGGVEEKRVLAFPTTSGHAFVKLTDPYNGQKQIKKVVRSDGKLILSQNAWISRFPNGGGGWDYYFNLYDFNTPGSYDVYFVDEEDMPHAPVMQYISDKTVSPGNQISFIVESSDQDSDALTLTAKPLPSGATFQFDEVTDGLYVYAFDWTPTAAQVGGWPITFTASDGALTASRTMTITVGDAGYALTVVNGAGSGNYAPNAIVSVSANPDKDGLSFDHWDASVGVIADVYAATTTLTMPAENVTVTAIFSETPLTTPLVVHWPFQQDAAGAIKDLSGYNFHGALSGTATWVAGAVSSRALSLDGTDNGVTSAFKRDLPIWTAAMWVNPAAAPTDADSALLLDRGANFQLTWNNPDAAFRGACRTRDGNAWTSAGFGDIAPNEWCHLAAVYDGAKLKTYKNGALIADVAAPAPIASETALSLAPAADNGARFAGLVDDARIYQIALSDSEIAELVANATGIFPAVDQYQTPEDQTLTIAAAEGVLANDSDREGRAMSVYALVAPMNGTLTLDTDGGFSYAPIANFNGPDSFSYTIDNGVFTSSPATVFIAVTPGNDAPVAVADSYNVNEDETLPGNVLSNDSDIDGDALSAVLVDNVAHGTLTLSANGAFSYLPAADYYGPDAFSYQATDGVDTSASVIVSITVKPVNDPPVAVADSYSVNEDATLIDNVLSNDSDIDGDALSAILVSNVTHGTLTLSADGSFAYVPTANYHGQDAFSYRISDGVETSAAVVVSIAVNPVNDAPVAVADSYSGDEDTTITGAVLNNDSDIDGDALSAVLVDNVAHGTLTLSADGSFTYVPTANYHGQDSFSYRAFDGALSSSPATVTIAVNPVNDAPMAVVDSYSVNEDSPLTVSAASGVLANDSDVDGDSLTAILVTSVGHGTLFISANGAFTYTPSADFYGEDSFVYTASDGALVSEQRTVTIAGVQAQFRVITQPSPIWDNAPA